MRSTDFLPSRSSYPFESRWFDGPRGRMHYIAEGEGTPLLLLHGNPTWSFLYRKMIPPLCTAGFRCVAPDLLGYGLSEHPDGFGFTLREQLEALRAFALAFALEGWIVVGQDWGGPLALGVALELGTALRGIVLGSTFAWRSAGLTRIIGHLLRSAPLQRRMIDSDHFIDFIVRRLTRARLTPEELSHYQLVAARPELRRAKAVLPRELIDADEWLTTLESQVFRQLRSVRTLLIHAQRDVLSGGSVRRLGRMLPNHAVLALPNAGHFFQEDAPREVALAIAEHFGSERSPRQTNKPSEALCYP
jgi:haloalkane dehalogenase